VCVCACCTLSDVESSSSRNSTRVASMPRGQQKLSKLFRQQQAFPRTSSKWVKLTESFCYFLAKDTLPFDTVNGSGFRKFLLDLEPRYKPLDRKVYLLYTCQGSTKLRRNQFYKSCTFVEHLDSQQICGHHGPPILM